MHRLLMFDKDAQIQMAESNRFGSQAVMTTRIVILDPWLCVPTFRGVCLYRTNADKVQNRVWYWVPGLLFGLMPAIISKGYNSCLFISAKMTYRIATRIVYNL